MLKRISPTSISAAGLPAETASLPVLLRDAAFPAPFAHGLEYSPPCRGTWNIVHTGMQIPETHQIFICASGCLRGVVLTAAEMGLMGRFSSIELHEHDLTGRDNERLIIEGTADILARLSQKPRAILLYPACVHHFSAAICAMSIRNSAGASPTSPLPNASWTRYARRAT